MVDVITAGDSVKGPFFGYPAASAVSDAAFGAFRAQLEYKAASE
jgi:hypothetical protein